ncbi:MAG: uroporphyrinogen-III C-methyltransferase [Desulfovibrionaceae bacterium]|nr:uroporphyrinogen-III C-methyltransferase [Desulfovibrionaceae bacterium]
MKVYLLGAGPGDPGLLTLKAKEVLAQAQVVVYDALANTELLDLVRKDAEIIYVGKVADQHALPQDQINQLLVQKAQEKGLVARLKGGDPYIFGRGGEEAQYLREHKIPFEEVPGISSTIAAPAYAGIPLTHRDLVSSVTLITGHEKAEKSSSSLNWEALAASGSTLVFVMGMKNLPLICENLQKAGLDANTPAALIYRGTTPKQRSLVATLKTLAKEAKAQNFTNPSVIVVGEVVRLKNELNWFEEKPLFGQTIVVTRAREQASDLAKSLEAYGAEVIQCPTIAIQKLEDQTELKTALKNLAHYQWLIFTSANSVKIFFEELAAQNLDARSLYPLKICTIGPGTKETLANYGLRCDLMPKRFVAESVVEAFLEKFGDNLGHLKILLPRAAKARDILPESLAKHGAKVQVIPVYKTVAADEGKEQVLQRLEEKTLSCITFTSTSTVQNFLKIVKPEVLNQHKEVKLAAIGPITAKALQDNGLSCDLQPSTYTIEALVATLREKLAKT